MQGRSGRRQPGEHLPPGESRKVIIRYLFEQERGQASEPDIRDHLRTAINLSDGKNIRNRLGDLCKDGLIHIAERRGGSNIWALQPTEALLKWCYDRFSPEEFYTIYTSPPMRGYLQTTDISSDDTSESGALWKGPWESIPPDEEIDWLDKELIEWRGKALLLSPTMWLCAQGASPEIITITRLLNGMRYRHPDEDYMEEEEDGRWWEYEDTPDSLLVASAIACLLVDSEKYPMAAVPIYDFLESSLESECALSRLGDESFTGGILKTICPYDEESMGGVYKPTGVCVLEDGTTEDAPFNRLSDDEGSADI